MDWREEEWERAIESLMGRTVPSRCPRHPGFLKRRSAWLLVEGPKATSRYRHLQILSQLLESLESGAPISRVFASRRALRTG